MAISSVGDGSLVLAAPMSLTGRYARQGRMAAAGVRQAVEDVAHSGGVPLGGEVLTPEVAVFDDASSREGVRRALDLSSRAQLIVGPYGGDLVAEAARWAQEHGRVLWNHGGSGDAVQQMPGVVSVPSPASGYLAAVLEALAPQMPRARVLISASRGGFGASAAAGAQRAASALGMTVLAVVRHDEVPAEPDADVLVAAGDFGDDVSLVKRIRKRPAAVAVVAAGLGDFGMELAAEGVLAPSQWEEGVHIHADTGAHPADVMRALRARVMPFLGARRALSEVDYPVAQAYAATVIALRCVQETGGCDDGAVERTARGLRCSTFFGRFGLDADGRQSDHDMLVVQWREGAKRVVWPPSLAQVPLVV